jgi:hypothetical protein
MNDTDQRVPFADGNLLFTGRRDSSNLVFP